jgi:magnesium-transporting ATPase (P-type)
VFLFASLATNFDNKGDPIDAAVVHALKSHPEVLEARAGYEILDFFPFDSGERWKDRSVDHMPVYQTQLWCIESLGGEEGGL